MPDIVKETEREAKDALGIPRGKGIRVPPERQEELKAKVEELLKVSSFSCTGLLSHEVLLALRYAGEGLPFPRQALQGGGLWR